MKFIIAFALFIACLAQVHGGYPSPCATKFFYTNTYPVGHKGVVNHPGYVSHPYADVHHEGYNGCACSKCYPSLYTQQYRGCKSYY